jgi:phosphoribosylglycinamide formyltransferase 1
MHSIIIFASGKGSNAAAIIDYFKQQPIARVALIVSNKADAGVLQIAEKEGIPSLVINRQDFQTTDLVNTLEQYNPALIVLAGFLWKIPETLTRAFENKIINIHPALLPDFGGKGMYGNFVHEAVLADKRKESGITIHYVNEVYDSGAIIVQARCAVLPSYDASILAGKIHELEHYFFPRTIEFLLQQMSKKLS